MNTDGDEEGLRIASPERDLLSSSYGRDAVLARYKRTYNTPEKMGKLRFEVLTLRPLGNDHAMVLGKFFLTRSATGGGDASGHFTLVLHKGPGGWKIVHDHTS